MTHIPFTYASPQASPQAVEVEVARRSQVYRALLLGLGLLTLAGAALQLAFDRHWESTIQLIPWAAAVVAIVAGGLLVVRPRRAGVLIARWLAALLVAAAFFGVYQHVHANYEAGPESRVVGDRWPHISESERWWEAATGGVSRTPTMAPLAIAFTAACIVAASWRHPALVRGVAAERSSGRVVSSQRDQTFSRRGY